MKINPKHKVNNWTIVGFCVLGVAIFVSGGLYLLDVLSQPKQAVSVNEVKTPPPPPKPVSITSKTLFFGDVFWGRYINDWSQASNLKIAYPFSRLNEFKKSDYNAWIANLECPMVSGFSQSSAQADATLSFNCNPDYLPEFSKWFEIVSLANNHTDNRGASGFLETKQHLSDSKIQYFGHYDPAIVADACEVVSLPVTVSYSDKTTKNQYLPIALCGYNGVFKIPPQASLEEISNYAKYMPVIVMPHMGTEYQSAPDQLKTATYHEMIDQGADAVLGGHPHWVQNSESYKGKLIVYSMGNFIFDQQANKEVTRSASIEVVFKSNDSSELLSKWLAFGTACSSFQDDCLQQIQSEQLKKLNMSFQFGVVGGSSADKITKPATPAEQQEILNRLNWSNTINQLQPPESGLYAG